MRTLASLAIVLTATTASAGIFGDCSFKADRSVAAPSPGIARITIIGRAGSLHIGGRHGTPEIVATGTACASTRARLDETRLVMSRSGSELRIEAATPDNEMFGSSSLDFDVVVPDNIPLRVEDGSGELTMENVGASDVTDGSGDLTIRNVNGDLAVDDGSGDMTLENVAGNIRIHDGSGGIEIRGAGGVDVEDDGSGSLDIRDVKHDVVIGNKGSGSVQVNDIGGNLRVNNKGGGSIQWDHVAGTVDVPQRFRR